MTKEEYKGKKNKLLTALYSLLVIIIATGFGAAAGAYVDIKETSVKVENNTKQIEETCKKVDNYKADHEGATTSLWKKINKIEETKVDKREINNLKEYMGIQFEDIKRSLNQIKKEE